MLSHELISILIIILVIIFIIERFRNLIFEFDSVVRASSILLDASKEFGIDAIVTEQYPKGLLRTVPELKIKERSNATVYEKTKFSMLTPQIQDILKSKKDKSDVMIVGLETHVCVQQTALELLEQGKNVHVIVDAVSSQRPLDRQIALNRLARSGAYLTTLESAIFTLLGDASSPHFKVISNLAKDYAKSPSKLPGLQ